MPSETKNFIFNPINFIINTLIILLPFEVIINGLGHKYNYGQKFSYIYGLIAVCLIVILMTKINWAIAYKINKFLIIGTIFVTVLSKISSLVINTYTSNLFIPGFNSEVLPLILLVVIYIYSKQNQFIFTRTTKLILFTSIFVTNIFFVLNKLDNLPSNISEVIKINPNYYGILNLIYLSILTSVYIKSESIHKYWLRFFGSGIIFLQLIFAPLTALFSIAAVILLITKNKFPNLVITKYIVLTCFTIALGLGLLANLTTLSYKDYASTVSRDITIISNAKNRLFYGYGLGNTDNVGEFVYGSNYSKFLDRPLIKDNTENKELIPNVELSIMQLLVSGGIIYTIIYLLILVNIAYKEARSSYYFYPMLVIILTSLFFNPLSFLPIFYILALSSLFIF